MADGSLKFDTKIDTDGFEKGTNTLKGMMDRVVSSIKKAGSGVASAFSDSGSIDGTNAKIKALVDEIDQYRDSLYYLEKQGLYFGDTEYDDTYQKLSLAERALNDYKKSLSGVDGQQKKATSSAKRFGSSLKQTTKASIPLTKSIIKLSSMFKLLVVRMGMRAVIRSVQEGFQNLAQYSKQSNKDISALMTSLQTLKNSFATAFAPILTVVVPILKTLIGYLSEAISTIGQFFAAFLTGATTFTKAKDAQVDYAKSLKKTGKEANKTLSPIDKLNNVGDDSGGGGGYEAPSPAQMFEEVTIDSKIIDYAGKVKNALKPVISAFDELKEALDPIAKFTFNSIKSFYNDVLKPIGKWALGEGIPDLIEALKNLLSGINWDKLTNAISKLNKALGPLAVSVGKGFVKFVKDITNLLKPVLAKIIDLLADAISNLADILGNVDPKTWEDVGYAIGVVGTAIAGIKIAKGLPAQLTELGIALSSVITSLSYLTYMNPVALPALFDLLGLDDWLDDLYKRLPQWIRKLWEGFWQMLYDLALDVFNFDETFKIWERVAQAFRDASDADTWWEIGADIINGIFLGIAGILSFPIEVVYDFFDTLVKNIKKVFGIASPAKNMEPMGRYILLGILEGFRNTIKDWISAIADWGKITKEKFGIAASNVWSAIREPFSNVKTWFSGKFKDAWEAIKKIFSPAAGWFNGIWDDINTGFSKAMWRLKDLAIAPLNAVIGLLNRMIDAINSISFSVPDWGWLPSNIRGQNVGFNIKNIPKLATGTVVPANYGEFLSILGDNRREPEVVSPIGTLKQAVREVAEEIGGLGGGDINLNVFLEGKQIYSEVVRQDRLYRKSSGGKSALVH
jgi:phage-related protein